MTTLDIIIPTFGRAERLARVVKDAHDGTPDADHVVTLVVETDDEESVAIADILSREDPRCRMVINDRTSNYAGAINCALAQSDAPMWFAGADDLHFHPGWFTECAARFDNWFCVVGTNDLLNPFVLKGLHATHYLCVADYVRKVGGTMDQGPGIAYFEGYHHQWTDTEFVGVAKARCRFRPCLEAVVEHMHFLAGKSPRDATYDRAYSNVDRDQVTYQQRKRVWDALVR